MRNSGHSDCDLPSKRSFFFGLHTGITKKKYLMKSAKKNHKSNFLSKLCIYSSTRSRLLKKIAISLESKNKPLVIFTPNPEQVVLASRQKSFAKVLCQADLAIPDGIGLILASRLLSLVGKGEPLQERIPGVEVVENILYQAKQKNHVVMVIGGKAYTNLGYKNWQIREFSPANPVDAQQNAASATLYWVEGYANAASPTQAEEKAVALALTTLRPDVVFVALGAPTQEEWVIAHKKLLSDSGVRVAMVVGGAFDMLLGKVNRAPLVFRKLGLEWLFRLFQEPWRWKRQVRLLEFLKLVIREFVS